MLPIRWRACRLKQLVLIKTGPAMATECPQSNATVRERGRWPRLSEKKCKKLLKEGRCFKSKKFGHVARDCRISVARKRQSLLIDGADIGVLELGNSVSEECIDIDNCHQLLVVTVSTAGQKRDVSSILELHTISFPPTGSEELKLWTTEKEEQFWVMFADEREQPAKATLTTLLQLQIGELTWKDRFALYSMGKV